MMLSLKMALRSISSNKMRAMLTMLGIIIGVMALVVLVSLVNGATSSVTDAVSDLGSSLLTVTIEDDNGYPVTLDTLGEWMEEDADIPGKELNDFSPQVFLLNPGLNNMRN